MVLMAALLALICAAGSGVSMRRSINAFDKSAVLPLRGLLVLLVVLGHSLGAIEMSQYSFAFPAVSVFFFISGYGLMQKRLHANGKPLGGGFRHAVVKLMPAFLMASAVYFGWRALRGETVPLLQNIITGSSSLPIPFTWYVPAIISLYGIFYLADRISRDNRKMLLWVTAGVAGYWVVTALVFCWPFYWWKAVGGFVSGLVFAANEKRLRNAIERSPVVVYLGAAVVFAGLLGLSRVTSFPVRFAVDHLYLAALGPIVALVMYCFRLPKALCPLGAISYEMYVVHGAFVWSIRPIIENRGLYVATVAVCAVSAGVVLRWCVRRCMVNLGRQ